MQTKKCSKCLNLLNISFYYKDKNKTTGLSSQCKNNTSKQLRLKNKNSFNTIPKEKSCFCCKEIKLNISFYKTKTNKDGLSIYCKKCILQNIIIKKWHVCNLKK